MSYIDSNQCEASSWRGSGETTPYGPGGYNRCVRVDGHGSRHVDSFGNIFRLFPTFKVLGQINSSNPTFPKD